MNEQMERWKNNGWKQGGNDSRNEVRLKGKKAGRIDV